MPRDHKSLARWIEGQRIGLAGYALCVTPGRFREQDYIIGLLENSLRRSTADGEWNGPGVLGQLSPSSITLLRRAIVMRGRKQEWAEPLARAHARLLGVGDPPIFVRAQIWVHHLLLGTSNVAQLLRLGKSLFGGTARRTDGGLTWTQMSRDDGFRETLAFAMEILRSPDATTTERLAAVTAIRCSRVGRPPTSWFQIENLLIEYQLGWPLLVAGMADGVAGVGVSLPVSVDVTLGKRRDEVVGLTNAILDISKWKGHLGKCAEVGRQLWRSKRGNHGAFRDDVAQCGVTFDFSIAQEIGRDLHNIGFGITLDGGSADTYLAQLVLSRLLGRRGLMGSAVTGAIGERMTGEDDRTPVLNYTFEAPGGVREKLDYILSTRAYERIVLPNGTEHAANEALELAGKLFDKGPAQNIEVVFAHNQQIVADAVQGGHWRQFQYVRCPELVWGIHGEHRYGRPMLLPSDHPEVAMVLSRLAQNQEKPVLELTGVGPAAVASALWAIQQQRELMFPHVPPMMSWTFVHFLDTEVDSDVWRVLWRVTGAPTTSLESILQCGSREDVARAVADTLNRFEPTAERPGFRAPDILVLSGVRHLVEEREKCPNPRSRPLMVWPVLKEMNDRRLLSGPFDEAYRPLTGRTRIIVIANEPEDSSLAVLPESLGRRQYAALRMLSVLEWGFTLHTAGLVLDEEPEFWGVRLRQDILGPLVAQGLLRFAEGRYVMPGPVVRAMKQRLQREDRAAIGKLYLRAGLALASFASRRELPGVALDAAFAPENINEAERAFRIALRCAQEGGDHRTATSARTSRNRVTRFLGLPSWSTVDGFIKSGTLVHDAHDMAEELLGVARAAGATMHPVHLATAGRSAAALSKQFRGDASAEVGTILRNQADAYFREALRQCDAFLQERTANRLHVLSEYACFLMQHEQDRGAEAAEMTTAALELLNPEVNGLVTSGEWYRLQGDREVDHDAAFARYRLGSRAVPGAAYLWLKALGSAILSGQPLIMSEIETALDDELPRVVASPVPCVEAFVGRWHAMYLINATMYTFNRERHTAPAHVRARWGAALEWMSRRWAADARVQQGITKVSALDTY